MITKKGSLFLLETDRTTYCFRVMESGHLEHLYYGPHLGVLEEEDAEALTEKRAFEAGNMIVYSDTYKTLTLEDLCLEVSGCGKGDIREPFVELVFADGSRTTDFLFSDYSIASRYADSTFGSFLSPSSIASALPSISVISSEMVTAARYATGMDWEIVMTERCAPLR